jgi:hypothetical protein
MPRASVPTSTERPANRVSDISRKFGEDGAGVVMMNTVL